MILVIEPINALDVPSYLVPTPDDVAALLGDIARPNVRMLMDAYHVARGGGDPVSAVHRHGALIGHAQYADHPGRGAPGTGTLSLTAFVEALAAAGYTGAVGLEFDPGGPTTAALAALSDALNAPAAGSGTG